MDESTRAAKSWAAQGLKVVACSERRMFIYEAETPELTWENRQTASESTVGKAALSTRIITRQSVTE